MSQPKKEKPSFQGEGGVDTTPQKPPSRPPSKPSFTFQGEGGEDNNSDNTDSGTVVTNKEVDDVIAEYKLPPVLTSYNNTVKNLQTYLNNTPIAPGLSTDGRWGAKTSAAVSDFQRYKDELYKRSTTAAERFNETGDIASRTTTKPAFERIQVADSSAGFGALSDAAPKGSGIVSRPSAAERMAGPDWFAREEINKAKGIPITDQSGVFSNIKLERAISGSVTNPLRQSLLKGAIKIETSDNAPGMENMGYRLGTKSPPTGAYASYNDAVVDQALASLTAQQQARAITNVPMNALGEAIMDLRYDDGGTGRGGAFYRGGGLIQITGHNNYQEVQNILARKGINVDLIANPGLVNDTRYALPAALAFLEYAGLTNTVAEGMSAKRLNNMINSGADRVKAVKRWDAVISSLRAAGDNVKADAFKLRNEYAAQIKIGFTGATDKTRVDGSIGPESRKVMREYLTDEGVTIPANITDDALVILVNEN